MWKRLNKNSYIQVLFVFAAFALMVTIGGLSVSNTLQESSLAAVNVAMDETEKTIRAYLREPKIAFYIIYAAICDILDEGESQEAVTRYLTRTMDLLGGLEDGIRGFINLYGYIREEMMYGMPFDADIEIIPQQRPWYQTAVRNREAEYTAPYIDLGTNLPIISLAKEIYGYGGEYYGVLALDVDISWLMGYAESLQFVEGGYGMIVSQYLQVIAHPN
ncbi:MAG: cache domain-containing protein, partial [Oscillospiraceae bacterium]|nr:cache domain-containing protein [Oscillospiraceae bacterium]